MSLRSPKHKFSMTVTFDEYIENIGNCITTTSDDVAVLSDRAKGYGKNCHVVISKNMKQYPGFEWEVIKEYDIKLS